MMRICKSSWNKSTSFRMAIAFILFLILTQPSLAQFSDNFSEASVVSAVWEGDRDKYTITSDGRLQLTDTDGGTARLYTRIDRSESQEWAMDIELDFSPSASNRLEIFLVSDFELSTSSKGLLMNIGESGSDDAIQLFEIFEGQRTLLADGSDGLVSSGPVSMTIRATLSDHLLLVEVDQEGSQCFLSEIETSIDPELIDQEFFFGFISYYTSSRSDKFFWDNIYVGPQRFDLEPPQIEFVDASANEMIINFSEPINQNLTGGSLAINPQPSDLVLSASKSSILLQSNQGWSNTIVYELNISGIEDLSGNTIDTTVFLQIPLDANEGDLLINEILFNPFDDGADYVEIINVASGLIKLDNLIISNLDNSDSDPLANLPNLQPGELLVITDNRDDILLRYSVRNTEKIFEIDIPRFNNTSGNVSLLIDDQLIDSFDYDEDMHRRLIDDVEGISLERISANLPSNDRSNWTSALQKDGYGTPGRVNGNNGNSFEENFFELVNKVFSPNGDGDKDEVIINYQLDGNDYVASLRVYTDQGQLISIPVKNELLTSEGIFVWNGQRDDGTYAPIGIYILQLELFDLSGKTIQKKFSCGLGAFIN